MNYIEGDIFSSPAQVIVNTVNTVGVMGKGLALSFKNRYPQMFEDYKRACEKHTFSIGKLMLYYAPDHWILLFPTKENWRYPSKLEYIEKGLIKFVNNYAEKGITSIAFPKLGCGNGELDWADVKPLMEKYLKNLPIDVYIYLGLGESADIEHKQIKEMREWLRKNAKDMSFNGVVDDIRLQTAICPYEFNIANEKVKVQYKDGLRFIYKDNEINVSESDFFIEWDMIRNENIWIIDESNTAAFLIHNMLFAFGYLSKIKLLDKQINTMKNGFQLNGGLGRAYDYRSEQ